MYCAYQLSPAWEHGSVNDEHGSDRSAQLTAHTLFCDANSRAFADEMKYQVNRFAFFYQDRSDQRTLVALSPALRVLAVTQGYAMAVLGGTSKNR